MTIADSAHAVFITPSEVMHLLQKQKADPTGQKMDDADCAHMESLLRKNSFIKEVTCYKTGGSGINIIVTQRLPLLRVMTDEGEDYYLDEWGERMHPQHYAADLPVATGHISPAFARQKLVLLGKHLLEDVFWNEQVTQLVVDEKEEVTLVPRMGKHLIRLGKVEQLSKKFLHLRAFYEKVLPEVGWNKYSEISVAYTQQIICKKNKENN